MSQLFQKILKLSQQQSVDLQGKFLEIDRNQTGTVNLEGFRKVWNDQVVTVLKSGAQPSQLTIVEQALDFNRDGMIHYREFLNKVRNTNYQLGGPVLAPTMDENRKKRLFKAICKEFKSSGYNIEARFKSYDRNHSGKISLADFKNGLSNVSKLKEEEKVMIADHYDERNDGYLNYPKFLAEITSELNNQQIYDRIFDELSLHVKKYDLEYEFKQINPSGNNKVRRNEFSTFLTVQLAYQVNTNDLNIFLNQFPLDEYGNMDVTKLMRKLPKIKSKLERPEDLIYKLKAALRAQNQTGRSVYGQYDQNRDGYLDIKEMSVLLTAFGVAYTNNTQIVELISALGGRNNKVSQQEFEKNLDFATEAQLSRDIEKFFSHLHNYLTNSQTPLFEFFKKHDIGKTNQLTWRELSEAITSLNIELSSMEITKVLGEIDTDRNGQISFDELNTKYL